MAGKIPQLPSFTEDFTKLTRTDLISRVCELEMILYGGGEDYHAVDRAGIPCTPQQREILRHLFDANGDWVPSSAFEEIMTKLAVRRSKIGKIRDWQSNHKVQVVYLRKALKGLGIFLISEVGHRSRGYRLDHANRERIIELAKRKTEELLGNPPTEHRMGGVHNSSIRN